MITCVGTSQFLLNLQCLQCQHIMLMHYESMCWYNYLITSLQHPGIPVSMASLLQRLLHTRTSWLSSAVQAPHMFHSPLSKQQCFTAFSAAQCKAHMLSTRLHMAHQEHIGVTAPYTRNHTLAMRRKLITAAVRTKSWRQVEYSTNVELPGDLQPVGPDVTARERAMKQHMKQFMAKPEDLWWFVGFAEGIGSWTVITKQRAGLHSNCFTVNQKCPQVLYRVKTLLGFGRVKKYGEGFRYIVADDKHTGKLIQIFSGNLKLERTKQEFEKYISTYNSRVSSTSPATCCDKEASPVSLRDGWLSGMIDAKGRFSASVELDGEVELRFSLEEKDEKDHLERIRKLMGSGRCRKKSGMYCYTLDQVRERERLVSYLNAYPLRSRKSIPYAMWKKLRYRLLDGRERIEGQGRSYERFMRFVKILNELELKYDV